MPIHTLILQSSVRLRLQEAVRLALRSGHGRVGVGHEAIDRFPRDSAPALPDHPEPHSVERRGLRRAGAGAGVTREKRQPGVAELAGVDLRPGEPRGAWDVRPVARCVRQSRLEKGRAKPRTAALDGGCCAYLCRARI